MNNYKKEILYHVSSIVITIIFLIVATYYWFNVKGLNVSAKSIYNESTINQVIPITNLKKVTDNDGLLLDGYAFTVKNKSEATLEYRIYVNNFTIRNVLSNNYVKYSINGGIIKTLNMDGMIYISEIDISSEKEFNLKIWISDTCSTNNNFNGQIVIV